ncbi:hypothetical protein GMA11_06885 [Granulicatella sp. zg-ZJ]|uniref:hypothetical protein n=1 Tax=Granulicatella sp. zg-ZJ TaxID=2678504 RepID=UPI0013D417C0|nr:hypothetical protein [Granulicatella sp. zg-ZJ]NEW63119.1 hypothetical protein [Granulicatella sp. zg-ZJ]
MSLHLPGVPLKTFGVSSDKKVVSEKNRKNLSSNKKFLSSVSILNVGDSDPYPKLPRFCKYAGGASSLIEVSENIQF